MASLQIPDQIDEQLDGAAACSGRSKKELVIQVLAAHLQDKSLPLPAFTKEQLVRLKESIEQIKRGEVVTSEQVELKFEAWFAKRLGD